MEWNIKENVVNTFFIQLTNKCIFKKNRHYLFSMINDVL